MAANLAILDTASPDSLHLESLWFMGGLVTVHADAASTHGQFALIEASGRPGGEPPLHVHQNEDELFYVVEGQLTVFCGGREMTLQASDSGFLPRGIPHTFKIASDFARFLVYITPAGFEEYFREIGSPANTPEQHVYPIRPDYKKMTQVAARLGVRFLN